MEVDYSEAWCVEEREIAWLRARGRGQPKKRRRNIGRAIRFWQRKLASGRRSISVPVVVGRVSLRKYGRAIETTYQRILPRPVVIVFDGYAEVTEAQIASALGMGVRRPEG